MQDVAFKLPGAHESGSRATTEAVCSNTPSWGPDVADAIVASIPNNARRILVVGRNMEVATIAIRIAEHLHAQHADEDTMVYTLLPDARVINRAECLPKGGVDAKKITFYKDRLGHFRRYRKSIWDVAVYIPALHKDKGKKQLYPGLSRGVAHLAALMRPNGTLIVCDTMRSTPPTQGTTIPDGILKKFDKGIRRQGTVDVLKNTYGFDLDNAEQFSVEELLYTLFLLSNNHVVRPLHGFMHHMIPVDTYLHGLKASAIEPSRHMLFLPNELGVQWREQYHFCDDELAILNPMGLIVGTCEP